MHMWVQKASQSTSAKTQAVRRTQDEQSPLRRLQRKLGNQGLQWMLQTQMNSTADTIGREPANLRHDSSRAPAHPRAEISRSGYHAPLAVRDKSVKGNSEDDGVIVQDRKPDAGTTSKDAGAPPVKKKQAGVDSFQVKWSKSPDNGPRALRLRLDYTAKFKKDDTHDPAVAEFRQNAFHKLKVIEGPHKGLESDNSPLHDDNYSRADDLDSRPITDTKFVGADNPGTRDDSLDKDDVVDYSFTAEQMIIDISDGNKQIAKLGPHTATIKGKHPRAIEGVPKTL